MFLIHAETKELIMPLDTIISIYPKLCGMQYRYIGLDTRTGDQIYTQYPCVIISLDMQTGETKKFYLEVFNFALVEKLPPQETCHCGRPVKFHYYNEKPFSRWLCSTCDDVRCDTADVECPFINEEKI